MVGKNNFFIRAWVFILIGLGIKKENLPVKTCSGLIAEGLYKVGIIINPDKHPLYVTPEEIYQYCLKHD